MCFCVACVQGGREGVCCNDLRFKTVFMRFPGLSAGVKITERGESFYNPFLKGVVEELKVGFKVDIIAYIWTISSLG